MRAYRSSILGALLALTCIPGIDAISRMEERLRETLMRAIVMWTPDLAPEATIELLLADVKATYGATGHTYESAADSLVGTLREWANNGRQSIVLRDEAVAGEWRARAVFMGPGLYRADVHRPADGGDRGEVIRRSASTGAQAWDLAVKEARAQADAARNAGYRPHPSSPGRLADGTIVVYDDIVKPEDVTPEKRAKMEAWFEETLARKSAADLAARHRDARDRLFSAYPAGDEARGRMEWPAELVSFDDVIKAARKWLAECDPAATGVLLHIGVDHETATTDPRFLAGLAAREIESRGSRDWFVSRAFVLREHVRSDENAFVRHCMQADGPPGHLPPRFVGVDMASETEFERGQRMAMNTPADRAMVGKTGPLDFKRAGELNRIRSLRLYEPAEPPRTRPDWPPRYSKVPKPPRPARSAETKAEQRERKAARSAARKRRGWS